MDATPISMTSLPKTKGGGGSRKKSPSRTTECHVGLINLGRTKETHQVQKSRLQNRTVSCFPVLEPGLSGRLLAVFLLLYSLVGDGMGIIMQGSFGEEDLQGAPTTKPLFDKFLIVEKRRKFSKNTNK